MADKSKDVIYIDIDDEITGIIDKVRASGGRIIALVLPKRASVFQSIVNMKLLKRSADEGKKRLVLITSEAGLLPLAGAVGLHVAKTLQSKPEIPAGPDTDDSEETVEEAELADTPITAETAGDRPIGELAGPAAAVPLATGEAMETVELDNEDNEAAAAPAAAALPLAAKKDKKLKVPNFDRFRLWLALGALLLIAFIIFLYFAFNVLPKAAIAIKTNASNVNTSLNLTLDTNAKTLDQLQNVVPAKQVQIQKTYTAQNPATGQKNKGDKATGSITMTAHACGNNPFQVPDPVPAGTGVSSNGLTFITQKDTSFSLYGATPSGSNCYDYPATSDTSVMAQSGGTQYNLSANSKFTVAGFSGYSGVNSNAFTGGTDNIVTVVAQGDIDAAKAKVSTDDASVKQDLQNQLQQSSYFAVLATFNAGAPTVTTSANVGDSAPNVTVTEVITYTMFGAKQSDLKSLIDDQIKGQIDTSKQSILDDGLDNADVKVNSSNATTAQITLQTTGVVGPDINVDSIKKAVAGKKSGDIQSLIKGTPGVTDVNVKFSPFWVTAAPNDVKKITVTIAKPTNTVNTHASNP